MCHFPSLRYLERVYILQFIPTQITQIHAPALQILTPLTARERDDP